MKEIEKQEDNVLSDTEYRRFWITWDGGLIKIGRHQETAFFEWQAPDELPVHYVGFASYDDTADWKLHSFCDAPWEWQTE